MTPEALNGLTLLFFFTAFLIFCICMLFEWANSVFKEGRTIMAEQAKTAISFLINHGADVVLNSKHIYKRGNTTVILVFDKNSNLKHDDEEKFEDEDAAIERFVELTGGKLVDDEFTLETEN
jgi:hypothetical protein